jgi:RNA polymerase sigma factor (sigma-70 family)
MKLLRQIQPEDELLKKAALGDRAGIAYLVNTYKDFAFTIALGIVSNREDAEEVVQDSFVKAFASLGKFKNTAKFSTWLYKIIYNTSITKIQYRKPSPVSFDTPYAPDFPDLTENRSWESLIAAERTKYVTLLLDSLAAEDRVIITLYYIGEKSIGEICDILGTNKSAIKMRLLRGRKQLETALHLLLHQEKRNLL